MTRIYHPPLMLDTAHGPIRIDDLGKLMFEVLVRPYVAYFPWYGAVEDQKILDGIIDRSGNVYFTKKKRTLAQHFHD